MGTGGVVVSDIVPHHPAKMVLAENQELIQTLCTDGPDPPLRVTIGVRRTNGSPNNMDTFGSKHRIKGPGELRVVVTNQKRDPWFAIRQLPHHLSGLLGHPGTRGMSSTTGKMNLTSARLNEHQHVDRLQEERFDGEKNRRRGSDLCNATSDDAN